MTKEIFDKDSYEQDLAMMMLDVLVKKDEISVNTYKVAQRGLMKEAEKGESGISGTAKTTN